MVVMIVWVPGHARTKGSVVVQRGRRVAQSVTDSEKYAALVASAVAQYAVARNWKLDGPILSAGPVAVLLRFWLPYDDVTMAGTGDVDKLARNVLDALTAAGAYRDDVQVKWLQVEKYPARPHPGPGLLLKVWPLHPTAALDEIGWTELQRHLTGQ